MVRSKIPKATHLQVALSLEVGGRPRAEAFPRRGSSGRLAWGSAGDVWAQQPTSAWSLFLRVPQSWDSWQLLIAASCMGPLTVLLLSTPPGGLLSCVP